MPKTLAPIPSGVAIVDKSGAILDFFRLRWQQLIDGFQSTPTVGALELSAQHAALATTSIYLTKAAGRYRVSTYLRETGSDGVSSSLQLTLGWTEGGVAQTKTSAAIVADSILAEQDQVTVLRADGNTDITIALAYASNTPGRMTYNADASVEQLA